MLQASIEGCGHEAAPDYEHREIPQGVVTQAGTRTENYKDPRQLVFNRFVRELGIK